MAASKGTLSADLFFVVPEDGGEFEAHVQVSADSDDVLFAKFDEVLVKLKNRGYKPRSPKGNTYVKVAPKYPQKPKTMEDAASDSGLVKSCPVCDTQMNFTPNVTGAITKTGPFKGQKLADSYTCPKCQKKVWVKTAKPEGDLPY